METIKKRATSKKKVATKKSSAPKRKRDMSTFNQFLDWINSDNVIKTGENEYKTQDSQYRIKLTRKQAYAYFKKEFIS